MTRARRTSQSTPQLSTTTPSGSIDSSSLPKRYDLDNAYCHFSLNILFLDLTLGFVTDLLARKRTFILANRRYLESRLLLRLSYLIMAGAAYYQLDQFAANDHQENAWDSLNQFFIFALVVSTITNQFFPI